jgi:hypothetical protein
MGDIPRKFSTLPILNETAFLDRLRKSRKITNPPHPWTTVLRTIRGSVGHDGVERIATETIFEKLDIAPVRRTPEAAKRLRGLMVELGWTPVRARAVTARGSTSPGPSLANSLASSLRLAADAPESFSAKTLAAPAAASASRCASKHCPSDETRAYPYAVIGDPI